MSVGEVLDVRLATSSVLPRQLILGLADEDAEVGQGTGFIVSTTWTSH